MSDLPENVCHCGTLAEANAAAEKLFAEIAGTDCTVWAFQIACLLRSICIQSLEENGLKRPDVAEAANNIVQQGLKHRSPITDIHALAEQRREQVHG